MCLAIPAKVIEISDGSGIVSVQGNNIKADFTMLDDVGLGDFVLLHAGFAIKKYAPEDAQEILKIWAEMKGKP